MQFIKILLRNIIFYKILISQQEKKKNINKTDTNKINYDNIKNCKEKKTVYAMEIFDTFSKYYYNNDYLGTSFKRLQNDSLGEHNKLKNIINDYNLHHKLIFILSPVITFFFTIFIIFMIPFDACYIILESSFSILFLLAISSLSVHGIIFSG